MSQFTEWIDGNYIVKSEVDGKLYPFPINIESLEQFFKVSGLTAESAQELLNKKRANIASPQNSEEFVLSRVGKELYEAFYKNYTLKQWNKPASELDPSVCGRIPVKLNKDPYYVNHKYRKSPKEGFTIMFSKMIDHHLIDVRLRDGLFCY